MRGNLSYFLLRAMKLLICSFAKILLLRNWNVFFDTLWSIVNGDVPVLYLIETEYYILTLVYDTDRERKQIEILDPNKFY